MFLFSHKVVSVTSPILVSYFLLKANSHGGRVLPSSPDLGRYDTIPPRVDPQVIPNAPATSPVASRPTRGRQRRSCG